MQTAVRAAPGATLVRTRSTVSAVHGRLRRLHPNRGWARTITGPGRTLTPFTLLHRYRPAFHPELEPLWREKPPRLFRAFGQALISQGHPAQALEVVCRAL